MLGYVRVFWVIRSLLVCFLLLGISMFGCRMKCFGLVLLWVFFASSLSCFFSALGRFLVCSFWF